jgi:hypothetical protein
VGIFSVRGIGHGRVPADFVRFGGSAGGALGQNDIYLVDRSGRVGLLVNGQTHQSGNLENARLVSLEAGRFAR